MAEWRDRQILAAAALINSKAIDARAAFDREIETATAADSLFNPASLANARIDALLGDDLRSTLPQFLDLAANELTSIDQRLARTGEALRQPDRLVLPRFTPDASIAAPETEEAPFEPEPQASKRGLFGVPAMLARQASTLAEGAGSAADELLQDKLGLKNRLRTAAALRIEQSWMGGAAEPKSVLAQLVSLIDETTHAARMALS